MENTKMHLTKEVSRFVLRRAWRAESVKRGDILRAFDGLIASSRASELLSSSVRYYPDHLSRRGNKVFRHPDASPPRIASEEDLMDTLFAGRNSFRETGLTSRELPVRRTEWLNSRPPRPGTFAEITKAFAFERLLHLDYVSLRENAVAESRLVAPVALEDMAGQWRLRAYDLSMDGQPRLKAFVLSRILFARAIEAGARRNPRFTIREEATAKTPVRLDPRLTADQRTALCRELRIEHGFVSLRRSEQFEFFRRYGRARMSENAVWPPLLDEK
jgi:WYL domain